MSIVFDKLFFHEKTRRKILDEKTEPGAWFFFLFERDTPVPLAKSQPCLSRNHNRASRESKTVTLVKGKKQKTRFFRFREARL